MTSVKAPTHSLSMSSMVSITNPRISDIRGTFTLDQRLTSIRAGWKFLWVDPGGPAGVVVSGCVGVVGSGVGEYQVPGPPQSPSYGTHREENPERGGGG